MSKHYLVRGSLATFEANAYMDWTGQRAWSTPNGRIFVAFYSVPGRDNPAQCEIVGPFQVGSSPVLSWFEVTVADSDEAVIDQLGADESGPMYSVLGSNAALRGLYAAIAAQSDNPRRLIRNESNQPVCITPEHGRCGHNLAASATHGIDPEQLPVLADLEQ